MSNQIQNQIVDQISSISEEWNNFQEEYKGLKNQVSSIELELNRPYISNDYNSNYAEKNAFEDYLRKGEIKAGHTKSFNSSDDQGGALIMPHFSKEIISTLNLTSPLRKLASVINTSSNKVDLVIEDGTFSNGWVGEEEARSEKSETSKLRQIQIEVHEIYSQPIASQRLLSDASIDIYCWIRDRLIDSFGKSEGNAFINGNGDKKPQGILQEAKVKNIQSLKKEIQIEDILNMINSLDEYYLGNASFIMNRATLSHIQTLKDSNGRFIWQPSYYDKQPQTLFGIPVHCCSDMPIILTEESISSKGTEEEKAQQKRQKVIALGDFKKGYKIVDREGISIMIDPFTDKPFVKFYTTKRVGGAVTDYRAINILEV